MEDILETFLKLSKSVLTAIGCLALTFMMFSTFLDVALRAIGHPIVGTFEVVALSLALVIGFYIPCVSLEKGNVYMEIVLDRVSPKNKAILNVFTRVLGIVLFALIAYNLFTVAHEFHRAREVTPTLRIPFYPVAYGVGVCCVIECLVFLLHIIKIWRGRYE
jgi:TRAP-type C4-dicarboxylate transport system permease small subunit